MSRQPFATQRPARAAIALPAIPVLAVGATQAALLTTDGEVKILPHAQAQMAVHDTPVLACHVPYTRQRLGVDDLLAFDVLELFAFVHPARFCVPTPAGLAKELGFSLPKTLEDYPFAIMEAAQALLSDLQNELSSFAFPAEAGNQMPASAGKAEGRANPLEIARVMGLQGKGWNWTPFVFAALGEEYDPQIPPAPKTALNIWRHLPEWSEGAPPPPPAHYPVTGAESRERLAEILGPDAEIREQQKEYATAMTAAFAPAGISPSPAPLNPPSLSPDSLRHARKREGDGGEGGGRVRVADRGEGVGDSHPPPHVILAEAGTGVGKTLGYLAPASVWAEKNSGAVWVSTYTKNLQRQIGQELDKLYPDEQLKDKKIAVRKGRENYLCLLNLEDSAAGAGLTRSPAHAVAAGLMARWAERTGSGDLQGGDFPGWLPGLLGYTHTLGLADRRGECIYSACNHYHKCFVERAARKAQHARIVVANHALVMIQTALAGPDTQLPQRYVFDEGHHLFDAADSAFAGHLSARESADMRRWILGPEGGKRTRARGLRKRVDDLIAGDDEAETELQAILHTAHILAGPGWSRRLKDNHPQGTTEEFLLAVYQQVHARAAGRDGPYSLETETQPMVGDVKKRAIKLKARLRDLQEPMRALAKRLRRKLSDNAETWDSDTRKRVESVCAGMERRADHTLAGWIGMLETLENEGEQNPIPCFSRESGNPDDTGHQVPASAGTTKSPPVGDDFVDWMEVERIDGKAIDVGLYRHWVDPMKPFAAAIKPHAHGIAVTSATLRDHSGDEERDWQIAEQRTGASYITPAPIRFAAASPYNYAEQTRVFVISDVRKDDMGQVADAYRGLFKAAGGGAIGLFTAIQRLRAVQQRILMPLEEAGITLYAQHADGMDTGTLVDIFREDTHACLLGTDAVRDGIDVPGESLRLLVYDRVPWPRPTILHKARREAFGGRSYDEMIARLKLQQAYGRLIRRASDKGVFVMLDSQLPTRLLSAFPAGVTVERIGLADAVKATSLFFQH